MSIDDGIRSFWEWWSTARDRVVRAVEVERKFSEALIHDISEHVDAIGDLDWELSPGKTAKHAFCLSPKGDPEARLVTELWRHRGPLRVSAHGDHRKRRMAIAENGASRSPKPVRPIAENGHGDRRKR